MNKDYSYNEVDTGKKWIDNKPIFRIVKQYSGSETASAPYIFNVSDLNIDTLLFANCLGHDRSNPNIHWNYRSVGNIQSRTITLFKDTGNIYAYGVGNWFPVTHLIIEYTKNVS